MSVENVNLSFANVSEVWCRLVNEMTDASRSGSDKINEKQKDQAAMTQILVKKLPPGKKKINIMNEMSYFKIVAINPKRKKEKKKEKIAKSTR